MTSSDRTSQELFDQNRALKHKIRQMEELLVEYRETAEVMKLERSLYLDMLNSHPAGIYRIRVFPSEANRQGEWDCPDRPPYVIESVNDRVCEILKIDRQVFEAWPGVIIELIHDDDREEFTRLNEEASVSLSPFRWDGRLKAEGEISWVHFESLPRPLANGEVLWTGVVYDISERKQEEQQREDLIMEIQKALEEIKTLRGIVPICAHCKKIRDDQGYWDHVESYVARHTDAQFSHSFCPECMQKLYPECCRS